MSENKVRSLAKRQIAEARRRRAAEALRSNLARRKNQQRVRALDGEEVENVPAKNDKT